MTNPSPILYPGQSICKTGNVPYNLGNNIAVHVPCIELKKIIVL